MTRFVIDAPTMLHLIDTGVRIDPAHQLVAPNGIRSLALQRLLEAVRAGDLTERDALGCHERITGMKMRLLGDRMSRRTAWRLARQYELDLVREAEYLAMTILQADALVTIDPDLASKASGIVPLAPVEDLADPE